MRWKAETGKTTGPCSGEVRAPGASSSKLTSGEDPDRRAHALLRIACHDLCTPLSAIQMHVQSVLWKARRGEDLTTERLFDVLVRLERLATEGARLVHDVLAVEYLESHAGEVESEADLEEALTAAVSLHAEALRRAGCDLCIEKEATVERIRGRWNQRALKSVFSNLLQNVTRYAGGAPVRIHLARFGARARIRFSDGGPGLPPRRLMSPEDPSSRSRAPQESHGLGIWIIHRAVAELGGQVEMRNGADGGLMCEIWLPLCAAPLPPAPLPG